MAWGRWKRMVRCTLGGLSLCVVGGLLASWWVAGALVAPRPRAIGRPPADLPATAFTLTSESGARIAGWHTEPDNCRGVVVLLHGIRGSRLSMVPRARMFHAEGFATVMIDFQAHGESTGEQITVGQLEKHDARAAVDFARRRHPTKRVAVLGVSLGGAAALLASPLPVDALVVESVYSDIEIAIHNRVAARLGPLSTIPSELLLLQLQPRLAVSRSALRPIDHIAGVDCPVFVVSGTDDHQTTLRESRSMFQAARQPKESWWVEGARHEDLFRFDPAAYRDRIVPFLSRTLRIESTQQ